MKIQIRLFAILFASTVFFYGCKDNNAVSPNSSSPSTSTARVTTALLINNVFFATTGDSITIPASVQSFIATNYPEYTIKGGHKLNMRKDTTIVYEIDIVSATDAKDVYFDINWTFVSDASRAIGDRNGKHEGKGGPHNHKDSLSTGTAIDPTTIPTSVTTFISTNYAGYTVVKGRNRTINGIVSNELLISNGTDLKALIFDATWTFISEQLKSQGLEKGETVVDITTIPTSVTTYITSNYTGYTIKSAVSRTKNSVISYEVTIISSTNKKRLIFDSTWTFVSEQVKNH
jgi:hypothetical protein